MQHKAHVGGKPLKIITILIEMPSLKYRMICFVRPCVQRRTFAPSLALPNKANTQKKCSDTNYIFNLITWLHKQNKNQRDHHRHIQTPRQSYLISIYYFLCIYLKPTHRFQFQGSHETLSPQVNNIFVMSSLAILNIKQTL